MYKIMYRSKLNVNWQKIINILERTLLSMTRGLCINGQGSQNDLRPWSQLSPRGEQYWSRSEVRAGNETVGSFVPKRALPVIEGLGTRLLFGCGVVSQSFILSDINF